MALGSLVWWLATLHIAGGLKLHDHCGPFQPRPVYDSMILNLTFWLLPIREMVHYLRRCLISPHFSFKT